MYHDPKGKFQTEAEKRHHGKPGYRDIEEWGDVHDKHFKRELYLNNEKVAEGEGTTKEEADKKAAEKGLKKMGWE